MSKTAKSGITTGVITILFGAVLWIICAETPRYTLYLLAAMAIPTALWLVRLLYKWLRDN